MSDRDVWSLGSKYILKERSNKPPSFEVQIIRFLETRTTIPIPKVTLDYHENDRHFILTERIPGDVLGTVWKQLSTTDKEKIAKQTVDYLSQLRQLRSSHMQSLGQNPLYSAFLFPTGYGVPHGPLSFDDELWAEIATGLKDIPQQALSRLRERMPTAEPYTFTHGDLAIVNIIVKDGDLAGILNWKSSGYFPVWWEFTCAGIGLGEDDQEWKALLRKYMPSYQAARDFWADVFCLRTYPDLNERGKETLVRLQGDEITE
jgi:aminoglycoside phosphotransferase (APT) family kinase protein